MGDSIYNVTECRGGQGSRVGFTAWADGSWAATKGRERCSGIVRDGKPYWVTGICARISANEVEKHLAAAGVIEA